jgi:hypothetical protein
MRTIFLTIILLLSSICLRAQSIFDTASCGGINKLNGYSAEKIFAKSQEWVKENITAIKYSEIGGDSAIILTALQDYNAKKSDKLPKQYSGKFEYTLTIAVSEGYYSYNFINVRYIPASKVKKEKSADETDYKDLRIKKNIWEKISRSAFKQLQETGKNYDKFMQAC